MCVEAVKLVHAPERVLAIQDWKQWIYGGSSPPPPPLPLRLSADADWQRKPF